MYLSLPSFPSALIFVLPVNLSASHSLHASVVYSVSWKHAVPNSAHRNVRVDCRRYSEHAEVHCCCCEPGVEAIWADSCRQQEAMGHVSAAGSHFPLPQKECKVFYQKRWASPAAGVPFLELQLLYWER